MKNENKSYQPTPGDMDSAKAKMTPAKWESTDKRESAVKKLDQLLQERRLNEEDLARISLTIKSPWIENDPANDSMRMGGIRAGEHAGFQGTIIAQDGSKHKVMVKFEGGRKMGTGRVESFNYDGRDFNLESADLRQKANLFLEHWLPIALAIRERDQTGLGQEEWNIQHEQSEFEKEQQRKDAMSEEEKRDAEDIKLIKDLF